MKAIYLAIVYLTGIMLFTSCEEYLEKTPDATVSNEDVFGTYESFQGFIDPVYGDMVNYNSQYNSTTANIGGLTLNKFIKWSPAYTSWTGDYWRISGAKNRDETSLYINQKYGYGIFKGIGNGGGGIWTGGWRSIRVCNVALENLDLLSDATQEEKDLIEGQVYFFRAYSHHQIIDAFGGMPYIDKVYSPNDEVKLARLTYHEIAEKIVEDYDRAIALLPVDWEETVIGSQRPGANMGRVTKGAAMAYKAKILLYAGSPLMNKFSGNDYSYNKEYCERAAAAGWDIIQLVNNTGIYELEDFSTIRNMYTRNDGIMPWSKETILQKVRENKGFHEQGSYLGRQYFFPRMGGKYCEQVNQLFVDRFEMTDGTRYKVEYDNDNTKRWENRDPRFRENIIIDREQHGYDERSIISLYVGDGSDKTATQQIVLPYLIKKFWLAGINGFDQDWAELRFISPLMRLAEVYLDYAEAVTVAYGPTGTAPGASLTAVDAVSIVRARAGMPPATAAAPEYDSFMDFLWNERTVELCFEGHYWYDIRRWHTGHTNLECVDLAFDKDWTTFTRSVIKTRVFEDPKHYWLPLNRDQVLLYPEFYQNPGW